MAGRTQWYWVSPDSSVIQLTSFQQGIETPKGAAGFGAPPLEITREVVPGMAGARTRQKKHGINEITLPLHVRADSFEALENTLRDMVQRFDGLQGDGVLGRVSTSGRVSELACTVTEGLRLDQAQMLGNSSIKLEMTFQADDPYWLGEVQSPPAISGAAGESWFPILPIRLSGSTLLGTSTITTSTAVPTFPVWTVNGPGVNPTFTNLTTGRTFAFKNTNLAAGEQITIDTRDYRKTVVGPGGANYFPRLASYDFWPLVRGTNQVSVQMSNATSESFIGYSYREKRLTP